MSPAPIRPPPELDAAVRRSRLREERGRREARSIGQDLALMGAAGWTIVVPTLLGIGAGRWLDRRLSGGIFWTLGLLVAGVAVGCALAWRRLKP